MLPAVYYQVRRPSSSPLKFGFFGFLICCCTTVTEGSTRPSSRRQKVSANSSIGEFHRCRRRHVLHVHGTHWQTVIQLAAAALHVECATLVRVADRTLLPPSVDPLVHLIREKSWTRFVLCGDSATGSSSSGDRVAENTSTT